MNFGPARRLAASLAVAVAVAAAIPAAGLGDCKSADCLTTKWNKPCIRALCGPNKYTVSAGGTCKLASSEVTPGTYSNSYMVNYAIYENLSTGSNRNLTTTSASINPIDCTKNYQCNNGLYYSFSMSVTASCGLSSTVDEVFARAFVSTEYNLSTDTYNYTETYDSVAASVQADGLCP